MRDNQSKNVHTLKSLWVKDKTFIFSPLQHNKKTEVYIIGAGISGLTLAYLLAQEGKEVIVLDDSSSSGETIRTSAHLNLTTVLDTRYHKLIPLHGKKNVMLLIESHQKAIELIEKIIIDEKVSCQFERVNGYLFAVSKEDESEIKKEWDAIQKLNCKNVELRTSILLGKNKTGLALKFPSQARLHPGHYLEGLQRTLLQRDIQIFTRLVSLKLEKGKSKS